MANVKVVADVVPWASGPVVESVWLGPDGHEAHWRSSACGNRKANQNPGVYRNRDCLEIQAGSPAVETPGLLLHSQLSREGPL